MLSPELYDMMPLIFGAFFVIYGILMIACPNLMLKKQFRGDQERMSRMRKSGIVWLVCAVMMLVVWYI